MQIYFSADAHLGHKNIHKMRQGLSSSEENTERFLIEAHKKLNKRTIVFFLGDVAFDDFHLSLLKIYPSRKILIGGNHDDMTSHLLKSGIFEGIHGMLKHKEFWLTHAPIHPQELRGKKNLHGHVHSDILDDQRYFNACPEATGQYLISLQEVRKIMNERDRARERAACL